MREISRGRYDLNWHFRRVIVSPIGAAEICYGATIDQTRANRAHDQKNDQPQTLPPSQTKAAESDRQSRTGKQRIRGVVDIGVELFDGYGQRRRASGTSGCHGHRGETARSLVG